MSDWTQARPILTAEDDGWTVVRQDVLARDEACVFAPLGVRSRSRPLPGISDHFCRDRFGRPIEWWRTTAMMADVELDHVKAEPKLGAKAPDSSAHLVVVCYGAHHGGLATSKAGREYERRWLASWYPETWAIFLERRGG